MAGDPELLYPLVLDGATSLVDAAYARFTNFTNQAWNLAVNAINDLGQFTVPQISFNARFDPQIALDQFPTIPAPDAPPLNNQLPPSPATPPVLDYTTVQVTAPPVDTNVPPVYVDPAFPTLVTIDAPGSAPTLAPVSIPSAPSLSFPELPDLLPLDLPTPPSLVYPTFTATAPVFNAPIPTETFGFSPAQYVDDLLTKTKALISTMQDGGTGLPAAVAKALRDRATLEADNEVQRATEEAYDDFAARGFTEPGGVLAERVARVRSDAQAQRAGTNRDIYVQDQQVAIENLRFAVTSGIQLEGQLIQAFNVQQQMALDAMRIAQELAISIFNARVSAFNAQVQAYQVDAEVFRDLIQAESLKVELYKGLLEGEQTKAQISSILVERYRAQLQGVQTLVDVYKAQLEAVNSEIAANAQQLDIFRTRVSVMSEEVKAQTAQIEGYKSRIEAQTAKASFYEAATRGFAARVTAYSESTNAQINAARLGLETNQLKQTAWRDTITLFSAQVQALQAQMDTIVREYGMQTEIYRAKAQVATAAAEANNRAFQLNLAEQQAVVDTSLKNAELLLKQVDATAQITSEVKKAIAQVAGQLTAAAMSAVSFHAGTNYSGGMSLGYNLGVNYSGTIS